MIGALLAGGGAAGPAPSDVMLNPLASADTRERLRGQLAGLERPVWLRVFTQPGDDEQMRVAALRLAQGVADLSDTVYAEPLRLPDDEGRFQALAIERTPAIAVIGEGDTDYGIRFYGVPGGGELKSLVAAVRLVASGDPVLSDASREALATLDRRVTIEVFATLGCTFCPDAVQMAHRLALASDKVTAAMVEVSAFPQYAKERGVSAVPKVVVNGEACFEGRRSEEEFVAAVLACAMRDERAR